MLVVLTEPEIDVVTFRRILVIDDEAMIQEVLKVCFEELTPWQVLIAGSGKEGLAIAQAEKPDAILLDVMMPGMDGLQVIQQLKALPESQHIPVVFLTAKAELYTPQVYLSTGAVGAISKPFDPLALVQQIRSYLGWEDNS